LLHVDRDRATIRHGLNRIDHKIRHDLLYLCRIHIRGQRFVAANDQFDIVFRGERTQQFDTLIGDVTKIDRFALRRTAPVEVE